jgi:hypothetical protein
MHINHTTKPGLRYTPYYYGVHDLTIVSKLKTGSTLVHTFDLPSPLNSAAPQQGASFGRQPKPSNGDNANSEADEYTFNMCLKTWFCTRVHKTPNLLTWIDLQFRRYTLDHNLRTAIDALQSLPTSNQHDHQTKPSQSLSLHEAQRKHLRSRVPSILDGTSLESRESMVSEARRRQIYPGKRYRLIPQESPCCSET